MNHVLYLPSSPREADMKLLAEVLPACVAATVAEVGVQGMKSFFDGYKENIDTHRQAA